MINGKSVFLYTVDSFNSGQTGMAVLPNAKNEADRIFDPPRLFDQIIARAYLAAAAFACAVNRDL